MCTRPTPESRSTSGTGSGVSWHSYRLARCGRSRSDKSFHSEAIRRAFPAAAHLPFEDDDAPHTDATGHDRDLTVEVARHLLVRRRPFRSMRPSYLLPRLAYTLTSRRYAEASRWLATAAL